MIQETDERLARQIKHRKGKGSIDAVIRRICKEEGVREQELKSGGKEEGYRRREQESPVT
jgi:hypothetical protein